MRILYFSPRVCWPVTTGARVRDFHLARQLALRAKLVYLSFVDGEDRREYLKPLVDSEVINIGRPGGYRPLHLVRGFLGPTPITVLNYTSHRMWAELERLLGEQKFDAIQVEGVHLFAYVRRIRELAPHARLVSDWHNIESEILARYAGVAPSPARQLYARRTHKLLARLERQLLDSCDAHTVCSERERGILAGLAPSARIEVIKNGVDAAYFGEMDGAAGPRRSLVFVGSMDYHANIDAATWFAREIWPQVRARRPDLDFVIVGSRPKPEVLALATEPGITVTGTVDDIRPYYARAAAVVVPLRVGSGTRLKVLEAMAAGAPVISTTIGAEGLGVTPGENVLMGDTPAEMAETAATLDAESVQWQRLVDNARQFVAAHYDWPILGKQLWRLYEQPALSNHA